MIAKTAFSLLIASTVAFTVPAVAQAQLSIPGKVMTYRTVDTDSGEELERSRTWESGEGAQRMEVSAVTYPAGAKLIRECTYANGFDHPAIVTRSVMRAGGGELERSDFDTFDPIYYPFLSEPVAREMQPAACISRHALDIATLIRGGKPSLWTWSDPGLIGVTFHSDGPETMAVAAGSFEALRVRIEVDLSMLFPRVPALFLKLVRPRITMWVTRAAPHYVLKVVGLGFGVGAHKNTAVELASVEELPSNASRSRVNFPDAADFAETEITAPDPPLMVVNSGSFAQGKRAGRITMSTASIPDGELLVTQVALNNGLATESRTLIDAPVSPPRLRREAPPTVYLEDRSYSAKGGLVRMHRIYFREAAFPEDPTKKLPPDLYGADLTLGLILPRLLPEDSNDAGLHLMDFYGQVNGLMIRKDGLATIASGGEEVRAIHAKLKPQVDIPLLLRPLAYFFIPTFDAYFQASPPHRLLKLEGPLGPPGAPRARMIADEKIPASPSASANR